MLWRHAVWRIDAHEKVTLSPAVSHYILPAPNYDMGAMSTELMYYKCYAIELMIKLEVQ